MVLPRGRTLPRLTNPEPLPGRRRGEGPGAGCPCGCALSRRTSDGYRVIDFARRIGVRLHPWQRWLLIHALELDASLLAYRFRTVLVLVARQNGKTLAKMIVTLWRMYMVNVRLSVGIAQDLSQAREVMNEGLVPMMLADRVLRRRFDPENEDQRLRRGIWKKVTNDEYIRLDSRWTRGKAITPHGPRYVIKALSRKAGRGLWDCAELNIDELREQTDFLSWSAVSKIVMAAKNSQIWAMSNAGDRSAVVLAHLRAIGLAGSDESMFIAEWSGPDGCELDDWEAIAAANPSLGRSLPHAAIRSALASDPAEVYRTEVLCQFVDSMSAGVDVLAWAACADATGALEFSRSAMVADVSADAGHVSLVAAAQLPDERVRLAVVREWDSTEGARRALPGAVEAFGPAATGWFPSGPGSVLSAVMRKLGATEIKGRAVRESCMTFADLVSSRRVLQPGHPALDLHVAQTDRVGPARSWEFDRVELKQTDLAWAAAGAVHLAVNAPRPEPPSRRKVIVPR